MPFGTTKDRFSICKRVHFATRKTVFYNIKNYSGNIQQNLSCQNCFMLLNNHTRKQSNI